MVKARRVVATGIAFATALSLAACSTGTVQVGQRPHQPTGTSAPSASTGQPSAIRLSSLPNWTEPTKSGATYTRPFTDSEGTFSWSVVDANGIAISYTPREQVVFGEADQYNQVPGVLTFRGNNHRTGGTYGTPTVTQEQLSVLWTKRIGEIRGEGSYWPGAGWTGQPLLVQWPRETKVTMGLADKFVNDDSFVEVIYPVFEMPRCSTGPPIWVIFTPSFEKWSARRGSVSMNRVSTPSCLASATTARYRPIGMYGKRGCSLVPKSESARAVLVSPFRRL